MSEDTFHHNDRRYKCCCLHVMTASRIIGIFIFIGFFTELITDFKKITVDEPNTGLIVFDVVQMVCVILLFVGLFLKRSKLLIPPIIIMIVEEVLVAIGIIILVLFYKFGDSEKDDEDREKTAQVLRFMIIFGMIVFTLNIIALYVIYRCYKYLKDVEAHKKSVESVALN